MSFIASLLNWTFPTGSSSPQEKPVPSGSGIRFQTGTLRQSYEGAQVTEQNRMFQPEHRSGDAAIWESWDLLTSRARDLVRNNPICSKVLRQLVTLVIGQGLHTYAAAEGNNDEDLTDFNEESDKWFERWAEEEADWSGEHSLWDLQRLAFQEMVEVGCSFLLRLQKRTESRIVPLSYQLLEYEQLARDVDRVLPNGGRIVRGIEYDRVGRKVAFHFYDVHPYDTVHPVPGMPYDTTRVPASRVIHNFIPSRPSATTGVTWFAPLIQPSRDVDWYLGNELTSAAESALLTLIYKTADRNNTIGTLDDETHRHNPVTWGHATVATIGADDDIQVAESNRAGRNAKDFLELLYMQLSMGSGLSVNRLLGDPSRANFASIKAAHQDDARMIVPVQEHQIRKQALPVRREFTRQAIGMGVITSVDSTRYLRARARFDALEWGTPGTGEVDTAEDAPAAIDRMRSGLTTYPEECAKRASNWKKNIRQMARVNKYAVDQEVVLDWTKGQGGAPGQTTSVPDSEAESSTGSPDQQNNPSPGT